MSFSPPMLGFLAGAALTLLDFRLPGFLQDVARYLGNLTTPLALIFIGVCLWKMDPRHLRLSRDLVLALLGKMVACPPSILAGMLHFDAAIPPVGWQSSHGLFSRRCSGG